MVSELRESEADKKENIVGITEGEGPGKNYQEVVVARQLALEQSAMTGLSESCFLLLMTLYLVMTLYAAHHYPDLYPIPNCDPTQP